MSGPDGAPDVAADRRERGRTATVVGGLAGSVLLAASAALLPGPLTGQYTIEAPSGRSLSYDSVAIRDMLERSRRLEKILQQDPEVIYYVGAGDPVSEDSAAPAYPWRAVTVRSDSAARVATPGNYREARRAYYNYAVKRMERVRSGEPPPGCSAAVEEEVGRVSAFVDGWIVARTLYGGPAFAPLDLFAFAREAGHLPALVVELEDTALSDRCLGRWREDHADAIEAYRGWRQEEFDAGRERAAVRVRG